MPSLMQAQFIQEGMPVDFPLWDPLGGHGPAAVSLEDAQRDEAYGDRLKEL